MDATYAHRSNLGLDPTMNTAELKKSSNSLLEQAEYRLIQESIGSQNVLGHYLFSEYDFREYDSLDSAYADFFVQIILPLYKACMKK